AGCPGRRFAFASEPAALLSLPWISREPAAASLARYLVHGGFAGEDCAYAALRQLAPASVLVYRDGTERTRRYWRPWDALVRGHGARVGAAPDADGGVAGTREALMRAVTLRVPAEVPFGVFLSGGIDSGLVAVLAARAWGRPFPTFSLRLEHRGYDESPLARRVARSIHSEHHEVVMTEREGERAFHDWASGLDQPLGDPSVLPTWWLARTAAEIVPVVLTGEGGDELFAGYPTYLGHRHAALADGLPRPVANLLLALARRLRPRHHHVTIAHMIERFVSARGLGAFDRHLAWFGAVRPSETAGLLAPELRHALPSDAPGDESGIAEDLACAGGRLARVPHLAHDGVRGRRLRGRVHEWPLSTLPEGVPIAHGVVARERVAGRGDHGGRAREQVVRPGTIAVLVAHRGDARPGERARERCAGGRARLALEHGPGGCDQHRR